MNDSKIEPALTPEEWLEEQAPERTVWSPRLSVHARMALLNAALPDDDPRKITRERIGGLRAIADKLHDGSGGYLRAMADALESYLPPTL